MFDDVGSREACAMEDQAHRFCNVSALKDRQLPVLGYTVPVAASSCSYCGMVAHQSYTMYLNVVGAIRILSRIGSRMPSEAASDLYITFETCGEGTSK